MGERHLKCFIYRAAKLDQNSFTNVERKNWKTGIKIDKGGIRFVSACGSLYVVRAKRFCYKSLTQKNAKKEDT